MSIQRVALILLVAAGIVASIFAVRQYEYNQAQAAADTQLRQATPVPGTRALDHLHGQLEFVGCPRDERPRVALIDPQMSQARVAATDTGQERAGAISISNVGGIDVGGEHQAERIP